jgi:hypothetical protein
VFFRNKVLNIPAKLINKSVIAKKYTSNPKLTFRLNFNNRNLNGQKLWILLLVFVGQNVQDTLFTFNPQKVTLGQYLTSILTKL